MAYFLFLYFISFIHCKFFVILQYVIVNQIYLVNKRSANFSVKIIELILYLKGISDQVSLKKSPCNLVKSFKVGRIKTGPDVLHHAAAICMTAYAPAARPFPSKLISNNYGLYNLWRNIY